MSLSGRILTYTALHWPGLGAVGIRVALARRMASHSKSYLRTRNVFAISGGGGHVCRRNPSTPTGCLVFLLDEELLAHAGDCLGFLKKLCSICGVYVKHLQETPPWENLVQRQKLCCFRPRRRAAFRRRFNAELVIFFVLQHGRILHMQMP